LLREKKMKGRFEKHRAQGTEHRAQRKKLRAQGTEEKAQGTGLAGLASRAGLFQCGTSPIIHRL
jgi:hypothetical protein